jgi:hypothetical protein
MFCSPLKERKRAWWDESLRRSETTPRSFPAQAKAMIQLFQNGGPSQMELFDPKPELTKRNGQPIR